MDNNLIEAAFFDVDHTITKHATGLKYLPMVLRKKRIPLSFLLSVPKLFWSYKRGKLAAHSYTDVLDSMVGISEDMLNSVSRKCFEKRIRKDIFPEMEILVENYRLKKIPVILATSSPAFIIRPLFEYLKADHLIATEIEFEGGYSTGRFKGEPTFQDQKLKRIHKYMEEKGYNPERCAFYSDSIHDISTLEFIGNPVLVNPDFLLRAIAAERQWPILNPRL